MLDFETLGTQFDTIVVSLGAVAFNKEGIKNEMLFEFDIPSQQKIGRSWDASTLAWWSKQGDGAKKVFEDSEFKITIAEFLPMFEKFIDESCAKVGEKRDELKPWGNGANFDVVICEDLFRRHHSKGPASIPWKFYNVVCFRTFNMLTGAKDLLKRHGVHHNALDDARYQAQCVLKYWEREKINREADEIRKAKK